MSDNYGGNEEFEKVDAFQDENVTSTSMTGDMAEEDRYTGSAAPNDIDLLGDFLGGEASSEAAASDPLISLGTPVQETVSESVPTQEPVTTETVTETTPTSQGEGVMGIPGMKALCGWMKTVDPRDELKDMEEPSPSNTGVTSPVVTAESPSQPRVSGESTASAGIILDEKFENASDSSSIISSSDNEYSSSADESDTESSDSPSEKSDLTDRQIPKETNGFIEIPADKTQSVVSQANSQADNIENLSLSRNTFDLEHLHTEMEVEKEIQGASASEESLDTCDSSINSETQAGQEFLKNNEKEPVADVANPVDFGDEPGGAAMNVFDHNEVPVDNKVGISEADMLDIIDKLTKDDESVEQSPDFESDLLFSNLNESRAARDPEFEKFVKGEEVSLDDISPVVSDNEECDSLNSKSSSSHSHSGSDNNSCTDSDVSGDEAEIGTWSPSPLYGESFGNFGGEEHDESAMDVEEQCTNVLAGYEYAGTGNLNDAEGQESVQQDNELSSLRADVKDLMEEMEAMVQENEKGDKEQSGEFIRAMVTDIDNSVKEADEETVPEVISTNEPLTSIMTTGTKERSKTPEGELLHVKFQTPTNTLFYDPECPIVEKVSMEVSDDLIDHDKAENLEGTEILQESLPGEQVSPSGEEGLEIKVVEDLKDVYDSLEAQGEIEGAMDLIKESGITNMDDIALQFAKDVLEQARNESLAGEKAKMNKEHEKQGTAEDDYNHQDDIEEIKPEQTEVLQQFEREGKRTPFDIDEEIITPEKKQKVSMDPFNDNPGKETGETTDALNNSSDTSCYSEINTVSEMETVRDKLVCELHNVSEENIEDSNALEGDIVEEPVVLRRKKVNTVEAENSLRNEVDSMIVHDVDILPERNTQSMIVHDIAESRLNDVLSTLKREQDEVSGDEKREDFDPLNTDTDSSSLEHFKIGLDEVEVRHRRLSSASIEEHGHISESVCETKNNQDNVTEQEYQHVFENGEDEKVVSVSEILNSEIDTELLENIEEINNEELEKKTQESSISKRAVEMMQIIYSEVLDLIYWRDVRKTGVVFGSMVFILLSLTFFTILSVLAYLSLAVLTVTLSFRVYRNVMQAVQKTNEGHPFKKLLDLDIALQDDVVQNAANKIAANINNCSCELRRLFLVDDYVDSLKFGLLLWLLTYVGCWFNGMTIIILAVVCIFTLPKVYETYQGPIDQNVNLVRGQLNNILKQVSSKIPFPKKKAKTQ